MKLIVLYIFFILILYASRPEWTKENFISDYLIVGNSSKNLSMEIKKKLALADAKIKLAYILETKVLSELQTNKKIKNKEYTKKIIFKSKQISHQNINNKYKILKWWINPKNQNVYVLIKILK